MRQPKTPPADTYSGIRWIASARYAGKASQLGIAIVLAHLLEPEQFGLMTMAAVIVGLLSISKDIGIPVLIVQQRITDRGLLSTLYWVNLFLSVVATCLAISVSPVAAYLYGRNELTAIIAWLSCNILLTAFGVIPSSLLQLNLQFKCLAMCEILGVVTNGMVAVLLATQNFGVFSLVAGVVSGSAAGSLAACIFCPFRPSLKVNRAWLHERLPFSARMLGFHILNYFNRNADNALIGATLGGVALGIYGKAYQFMLVPREALSSIVIGVIFPTMARDQHDARKMAEYYLRAASVIALFSFPMMAGLAILAEPFVEVVLGHKWLSAAVLIQILAPAGALQAVGVLRGQLLLATGRSALLFRQALANSVGLTLAVVLGVQWGLVGVCVAYSTYSIVAGWLLQMQAFCDTRLTIRDLMQTLQRSAEATAIMSIVLFLFTRLWLTGSPVSVQLSLGTIVGTLVYLTAVWRLAPPGLDDAIRLLRPASIPGGQI